MKVIVIITSTIRTASSNKYNIKETERNFSYFVYIIYYDIKLFLKNSRKLHLCPNEMYQNWNIHQRKEFKKNLPILHQFIL